MSNNYDKYLEMEPCLTLVKMGYGQVLNNIIEDDEDCISQIMKDEFFKFLTNYDNNSDIISYCNSFFYRRDYSLKGKTENSRIYSIELGRVCRKNSMRRNFNKSIENKSNGEGTITFTNDESLIDKLILEIENREIAQVNTFRDFIIDAGISEMPVQHFPMWTFEGLYDNDIFEGYDPKDLPCILGLPGNDGTHIGYSNIERVVFTLKVPHSISVHKPTSFDAAMMPVWSLGGKTKPHKECEKKYSIGFSEYVHDSVNFSHITSEIYSL